MWPYSGRQQQQPPPRCDGGIGHAAAAQIWSDLDAEIEREIEREIEAAWPSDEQAERACVLFLHFAFIDYS